MVDCNPDFIVCDAFDDTVRIRDGVEDYICEHVDATISFYHIAASMDFVNRELSRR